jgi:hypothetical protein
MVGIPPDLRFEEISTMLTIVRNALALALLIPASAFASSEAAWDQFAKEVEQKCSDATADIFRRAQIAVDPTGSEHFGLAIVYGRSKANKERAAVICVYDKKTGTVEVGGELGSDLIRVRRPKPDGDDQKANKRKQTQTDSQGQTNGSDQLDMEDEQ